MILAMEMDMVQVDWGINKAASLPLPGNLK